MIENPINYYLLCLFYFWHTFLVSPYKFVQDQKQTKMKLQRKSISSNQLSYLTSIIKMSHFNFHAILDLNEILNLSMIKL